MRVLRCTYSRVSVQIHFAVGFSRQHDLNVVELRVSDLRTSLCYTRVVVDLFGLVRDDQRGFDVPLAGQLVWYSCLKTHRAKRVAKVPQ